VNAPLETVEIALTVNGERVKRAVPARMNLADFLRSEMELTGTHLGCEHGVCGACTVLVDGRAARSCLLFCVQADGHEVTTVEALGSPEDLHPLQAAFRRHHALQCGFCTSGFLMSAYELLRDRPDGLEDNRRLREELSGVLCRCTGYAGIVEAVREVAREYPDGVPVPKALGRPVTVRGGASRQLTDGGPQEREGESPRATDFELSIPSGEPNERIDVTTTVSRPPEETWGLLSDFMAASRCMPGVELDTDHGDDTYSGQVRVHLGPMRMNFSGAARVLERDVERRALSAVAAGRDPSGSGIRALVTLTAGQSDSGGTALRAQAELYLSGRAAQFGRSLAGDVGRQLFSEFGSCVEKTLTGGRAAEPRGMAGGMLALRLLRVRLRALLRRLRRRRDET
jgi:aerobic-type carbon monoxide dehydrogenase small subunit (CoxS/CutS family)/carbon monoxide dehydrogenase subunit G